MKTLHVSQRTPAGRALVHNLAAMGMSCDSGRAASERGLSNGVKYVVGGWSSETRRELMAQAVEYPVMLVFTWKDSGEYLADVRIEVRDAQNREVLMLAESGPIVLLGLAPGTYRIDVTRNHGAGHTRTITVGARTRRQAAFYWDDGKGRRSSA